MRPFLPILFISLFLFLFSFPVYGQGIPVPPVVNPPADVLDKIQNRNSQTNNGLEERQEEARKKAEEKREELKEKTETKQEKVRIRIAENKKNQIKELISRLIERLTAFVERFEKLAERIQSRIDKLAEKGADTAEAQSQLNTAKAKTADVKGKIAALNGVGDDLVNSNNPKEFFSGLRVQIKEIKDELVEIHGLLASSMGKVKGLSNEKGANE